MARRTSPKARRRELVSQAEPDDVFVAQVYSATRWAKQNQGSLIVLGVVIAAIVIGVASYVGYRGRLVEQASLELERIQQAIEVGDPQAARASLEQYLNSFSSTPYVGEASLVLAELHLAAGQPEEAIRVLTEADVSLGEPIGVQMAVLRGKAQEAAGQLDEAEATYLRVADRAELDFQRVEGLTAVARIRTVREDFVGAAELYQRVIDGMEELDPRVGVYRMRLAEVRTKAGG